MTVFKVVVIFNAIHFCILDRMQTSNSFIGYQLKCIILKIDCEKLTHSKAYHISFEDIKKYIWLMPPLIVIRVLECDSGYIANQKPNVLSFKFGIFFKSQCEINNTGLETQKRIRSKINKLWLNKQTLKTSKQLEAKDFQSK